MSDFMCVSLEGMSGPLLPQNPPTAISNETYRPGYSWEQIPTSRQLPDDMRIIWLPRSYRAMGFPRFSDPDTRRFRLMESVDRGHKFELGFVDCLPLYSNIDLTGSAIFPSIRGGKPVVLVIGGSRIVGIRREWSGEEWIADEHMFTYQRAVNNDHRSIEYFQSRYLAPQEILVGCKTPLGEILYAPNCTGKLLIRREIDPEPCWELFDSFTPLSRKPDSKVIERFLPGSLVGTGGGSHFVICEIKDIDSSSVTRVLLHHTRVVPASQEPISLPSASVWGFQWRFIDGMGGIQNPEALRVDDTYGRVICFAQGGTYELQFGDPNSAWRFICPGWRDIMANLSSSSVALKYIGESDIEYVVFGDGTMMVMICKGTTRCRIISFAKLDTRVEHADLVKDCLSTTSIEMAITELCILPFLF